MDWLSAPHKRSSKSVSDRHLAYFQLQPANRNYRQAKAASDLFSSWLYLLMMKHGEQHKLLRFHTNDALKCRQFIGHQKKLRSVFEEKYTKVYLKIEWCI